VRRRLPLLFVTACSALAVGCSGGGDKPVALPSLTATPVTSASPAPIPPQATPNTSQGLDAFVRFYFQQLNVAFSTSDPSLIRRYSDPKCTTCNNYIHGLEASSDKVIVGDSFAISDVAVPPLGTIRTDAEVYGSVPPRTLKGLDGSVIESLASGGQFHFVVGAVKFGAGWRVVSIGRAVQH
jgi:hypothetical protein